MSQLLSQTSTLKLLLTSRQALELAAEQRLELLPLSVPDIRHLRTGAAPDRIDPEGLLRFAGVSLFVDRVQALRLDFRLGAHNAHAIATLCARLEGLPLALEIAAARAQLLTPAQMLTQLEDRFTFLVSRKRDGSARHRTLRATLEWSVRLLSPDLQQLLGQLSVFRGGWTLEAAGAVCGELEDLLGALEGLCNSSLILAVENTQGEMRFRMLETIREFASELLGSSGEEAFIRSRHGEWCLVLATTASARFAGPDQQDWLDRMEVEHDNLRAALTWSLKRTSHEGRGDLTALKLCSNLQTFWRIRGYVDEGLAWSTAVLEMRTASEQTSERASTLNGAGLLAYRSGDYTAARTYLEECLSIQRQLNNRMGIGNALNNLGLVMIDQADYEVARVYYVESLSIQREVGSRKGIAGTLNNLGLVEQHLRDFAAAETLYQEALLINREMGNRGEEANNLNNLGIVAQLQGDLVRARVYYEESLPIRKEIGDRWGIAYSLYSLGQVDCLQGDYPSAETYFHKSLSIRKEIGHRYGIAQSFGVLAELAATLYTVHKTTKASESSREVEALGLRAVQLWGAATALRAEIGDKMSAFAQQEQNRKIAAVREQLGSAAFAAAWSAGQTLTVDQAVAYALEKQGGGCRV